MNLPSRRAFRPDASYYRTTRRQRLSRSPGDRGRFNPVLIAAVVFAGLASWMIYSRFTGHTGFWTAFLGYGSGVLCVLSIVLASVIRFR